ncbi:MAG: O-antigen ligase family protein [Usitatibacter sp.]
MVATLLVFAPLIRGGNRPMPLLVLELGALSMLVVMAWAGDLPTAWKRLPAALRWALAILVAVPLVQLLPLPVSFWSALPGHAPYGRVLEVAGIEAGWRSISINPVATQYAALALLPCIAVLLALQVIARHKLRALALVFVAVAVCEALLGILQVGAGSDSLLRLGNAFSGGAATGTYINRNHFAGLMAMALPMLVAIWAAETLPPRDQDGRAMLEHPRHADAMLARRIAWSIVIVLVMAALLFTRSRAGIGCGLAAFAAAALGLVWRAGSVRIRVLLGAVSAMSLLLAAYVGLTPILERFAPDELSLGYDGRLRIAAAAVRGALEFLPLGSGLGTFADVFRRYQSEGLLGFIDHAHNDYAEAFLEMGVAGIAFVALAAVAYLVRWKVLRLRGRSRTLGYLQVSAGLAVLALALHGLFDFNFHIPANAFYFAFLAGIFLHDSSREQPAD